MSYWKDRKVLVTGASGFVGSNLVKALIEKEAKVVSLSRSKIGKNSLLFVEGYIEKINKKEKGSVLDYSKFLEILKRNDVEIIYHLAAQPLVEVGKESPIGTFEVNIKGTWNILEAAKEAGVEKVMVASTTHVYGDNPNLPYKEEYYPQPSRPYETSKACADLLSQSFADTYGLSVEIPRFTNLYGTGDFNFGRIVPKVIKGALTDKKVKIWDVGAVRDFLFIEDAIKGYLMLVEKGLPNEKRSRVFNFGSGNPVDVVELTKKIIRLTDHKVDLEIESLPEQREKEIQKQYVSIDKAKKILGWKPEVALEEGLKETINWYKKYFSSKKSR